MRPDKKRRRRMLKSDAAVRHQIPERRTDKGNRSFDFIPGAHRIQPFCLRKSPREERPAVPGAPRRAGVGDARPATIRRLLAVAIQDIGRHGNPLAIVQSRARLPGGRWRDRAIPPPRRRAPNIRHNHLDHAPALPELRRRKVAGGPLFQVPTRHLEGEFFNMPKSTVSTCQGGTQTYKVNKPLRDSQAEVVRTDSCWLY